MSTRQTTRGLCEYRCPSCDRSVLLATRQAAAEVLRLEGARSFAGPAPFELLEDHPGAPLAWDDVLDLHLALAAEPFPQDLLVLPAPTDAPRQAETGRARHRRRRVR